MRGLKVVLINYIINSFASMGAYVLRVCIVKFLIMLYGEVLPLDVLPIDFSFDVSFSRFG